MPTDQLPPQPTSFIGRTEELADIVALLADPACRLLTLIGLGGIGKTRLAIEAAAQVQHSFEDGACFVPLQPVSSTDFLIPAIADALHLKFYGPESSRAQLLRRLYPKTLLLVIDNFEHLLDDVALLTEILESAPRVKLLVTSRETLNVREEWVRAVAAMRVPGDDQTIELDRYDAARLFIERARQARGDFPLDREWPQVVRICRLVDGLPLGIELAAAQIRAQSCAQIADQIQHSMGFLATSLRNVPERHRDLYRVFEPCWSRLTDDQRHAFIRLSVFRGGFDRDAARQVAGASPPMLATLADKSLLRVTPEGRCEMHELVRQYAEARLAETADEHERAQDRHCDYYADFLQQRESNLKGTNLLRALDQIAPEIDNIRAMWRWAVRKRMVREIEKFLDSLAIFYHIRCWYQEAEEAFRMIVEAFGNERSIILGRSLMWQGHFSTVLELDTLTRVNQILQEGVSVLRELGAHGATAMPLWLLSEYNDDPEMRDEIKQFCLDNLVTHRKREDRWGITWALIGLSNIPLLEGAYQEAQEYSREALTISRENGDQLGMAAALHALIKVANEQGAYLEQKQHAQEALTLARMIDDRGGIAAALLAMGQAAYNLGLYKEAKQLLEQGFTLHRELFPGNVWPIAPLSKVALAMGDQHQARRYFYEALQGGADLNGAVWVLIPIARLFAAEGQKERAVELLTATTSVLLEGRFANHAEVKALLVELENALPPEVFVAARRRGEISDLNSMISALLDELSEYQAPTDNIGPARAYFEKGPQTRSDQPPIDALSERELEVLQLVATGLSNREIAQELVVTVGTVKKHLNNIFGKMNVRSRTQAIAWAREHGLTAKINPRIPL